MKNIAKIVEYWKQSGVELNEGINLEKIEVLEGKVNFKFPETFKVFYSKINGFKDFDMNENLFSIFPIERIEEEYIVSKNEMFIPFCDFLINSHQIGFSKIDKKIYIDYDLDKINHDIVAETFEQALIEVITDSEKIY